MFFNQMKTNKLFICLISAYYACMLLASCSQPEENTITGTWIAVSDRLDDFYQFHFDGNGKGMSCYLINGHPWTYSPPADGIYNPKYYEYKDLGNKIILNYCDQYMRHLSTDTLDYYIEGNKLHFSFGDYFRQNSIPYSIAPRLNLVTEVNGNQYKTFGSKYESYNADQGSKVKLSTELLVPGKYCVMTENKLIIYYIYKTDTIDVTNISNNDGVFSYEYTLPKDYGTCYCYLETTYKYIGKTKSNSPEDKTFTIKNSFRILERTKQ